MKVTLDRSRLLGFDSVNRSAKVGGKPKVGIKPKPAPKRSA
jgi:hypothetical protein